jgi:DNA polymerase V
MSIKNTGFPSPAEEYRESALSLDKHLIKNPSATFFMQADSDSMAPVVYKGDILVIDRSLQAENGKLIVASLRGEFFVRRLVIKNNKRYLANEREKEKFQEVSEEDDFIIFGVVSWVVHKTT